MISTNESYRDVAVTRSGKPATNVTVVRTGPDPEQLKRGAPHPELRRDRRFLAACMGVMGPQDGDDIVVRAADIVVHQFGRDDIAFTLIATCRLRHADRFPGQTSGASASGRDLRNGRPAVPSTST